MVFSDATLTRRWCLSRAGYLQLGWGCCGARLGERVPSWYGFLGLWDAVLHGGGDGGKFIYGEDLPWDKTDETITTSSITTTDD